jgi:hypothetical protein
LRRVGLLRLGRLDPILFQRGHLAFSKKVAFGCHPGGTHQDYPSGRNRLVKLLLFGLLRTISSHDRFPLCFFSMVINNTIFMDLFCLIRQVHSSEVAA